MKKLSVLFAILAFAGMVACKQKPAETTEEQTAAPETEQVEVLQTDTAAVAEPAEAQ